VERFHFGLIERRLEHDGTLRLCACHLRRLPRGANGWEPAEAERKGFRRKILTEEEVPQNQPQ
jgi:hypothetical protein